jgi:hypothetical protein
MKQKALCVRDELHGSNLSFQTAAKDCNRSICATTLDTLLSISATNTDQNPEHFSAKSRSPKFISTCAQPHLRSHSTDAFPNADSPSAASSQQIPRFKPIADDPPPRNDSHPRKRLFADIVDATKSDEEISRMWEQSTDNSRERGGKRRQTAGRARARARSPLLSLLSLPSDPFDPARAEPSLCPTPPGATGRAESDASDPDYRSRESQTFV